jgi:hypothetical protein
MPPKMNNAAWDQMIQHWLLNHTVIEIPYELTETGNLGALLKYFIDAAPEAINRRDLFKGMVLKENGEYLFHFESFNRFLIAQRYPIKAPHVLWMHLKQLGLSKRETTVTGNKKLNYWVVPEEIIDATAIDDPFSDTIEF